MWILISVMINPSHSGVHSYKHPLVVWVRVGSVIVGIDQVVGRDGEGNVQGLIQDLRLYQLLISLREEGRWDKRVGVVVGVGGRG